MNVIIEKQNGQVNFVDLKVGQAFIHADEYYIKTNPTYKASNAIRFFENGSCESCLFAATRDDEFVTMIDSTIVFGRELKKNEIVQLMKVKCQ